MEEIKKQTNETMPTDSSMLTGIFRGRESTESAYNAKKLRGYSKDDSLLMSDEKPKKHFTGEVRETEKGTQAAIGKSLIIPSPGRVVAAPIADGLMGAGIPEERAKLYESGIKSGNIVMGVNPRNDEDATYFENNWRNNQVEEMHT